MKIAIVTFHRANNYGAVLQAFALQTYLKNIGHDPFFIDNQFGAPLQGLRRYISKTPIGTFKRLSVLRRSNAFAKFVSEKLICEIGNTGYNKKNVPRADVYLCGSDQVWNLNYFQNPKYERLFFLDFGPSNVRRISYAASLGVKTIPSEWSNSLAKYLNRFDSISVREMDSVQRLAQLSRKKVVCVPDPTLLLEAEEYRKNLRFESKEQNIIFAYSLGKTISSLVQQTKSHLSTSMAIPLMETYERNRWRVVTQGVNSPGRWLSMLSGSKFVLTNSFHGTVFSIIFKRPFISLPVKNKVSGADLRITSLLEKLGLIDRFVDIFDPQRIDELCQCSIDWRSVDKKRSAFMASGEDFLAEALTEV